MIPFTENGEYFADYSHPLEKANKAISEQIIAIRNRDIFHKPISKRMREFIDDWKRDKKRDRGTPPSDIYTLH